MQHAPDPASGPGPVGFGPGGRSASDKLRRLLGGEPTAWIVQRARDRLETGRPLAGPITLSGASPQQRRAVERLTGRTARSGTSVSVSLQEVDRILRDSGAAPGGLAEAVTLLAGPLQDRRLAQAETEAAWRAAFAELDSLSAPSPLAAWRAWLDATGLVRRLAPDPSDARTLLSSVAAVLLRLPSRGIPIGRLAAECCGDAHALDDGRPVGTLALSAARALAGLPFAADGTADSRRAAWAAVGVHLDDLSSLVLCVGLPGDTRTPLGRMLAACREAGQPAMLTLRQLRCHDEPLRAGPVRICENPVVVAAAADELGARCQPLVCVSGQPSAAVWRLLELLGAGGATFAYHGDFDWGGVRIAAAVHDRVSFRPWQYDQRAYEDAVSALRPGVPPALLAVEPAETPWDPPLAAAMRHHRVRIEEELVLDTLLHDLMTGSLGPRLQGLEALPGVLCTDAPQYSPHPRWRVLSRMVLVCLSAVLLKHCRHPCTWRFTVCGPQGRQPDDRVLFGADCRTEQHTIMAGRRKTRHSRHAACADSGAPELARNE